MKQTIINMSINNLYIKTDEKLDLFILLLNNIIIQYINYYIGNFVYFQRNYKKFQKN